MTSHTSSTAVAVEQPRPRRPPRGRDFRRTTRPNERARAQRRRPEQQRACMRACVQACAPFALRRALRPVRGGWLVGGARRRVVRPGAAFSRANVMGHRGSHCARDGLSNTPACTCWPSRQPVASVWWEKAPRPSVPPRQPARRHGQRGSWLLLARRGGVQAQRAPARTCAGVSTYSTLSSALTTALLLWCSCRLLLSRRCSAGVAIERV